MTQSAERILLINPKDSYVLGSPPLGVGALLLPPLVAHRRRHREVGRQRQQDEDFPPHAHGDHPGVIMGNLRWSRRRDRRLASGSMCSRRPGWPRPRSLRERPEGWTNKNGCVVLIDEIDKADVDLPNGLLETLGNGAFKIPYINENIGLSHEFPSPLVIITTNEERELPAAFLRRCLVLNLYLPQEENKLIEFLIQRGHIHFNDAIHKMAENFMVEFKYWKNSSKLIPFIKTQKTIDTFL